MSCCIDIWEIKCLKRGDTTREKFIYFPFDITDCSFKMNFKKAMIGLNTNDVAFGWSTSEATILRSEDDDYTEGDVNYMAIKIVEQKIEVEPAVYVSDFEMTLSDGETVNTLFDITLKIVEDYS